MSDSSPLNSSLPQLPTVGQSSESARSANNTIVHETVDQARSRAIAIANAVLHA